MRKKKNSDPLHGEEESTMGKTLGPVHQGILSSLVLGPHSGWSPVSFLRHKETGQMQWYSEGGSENDGKPRVVPQWGNFKGMGD